MAQFWAEKELHLQFRGGDTECTGNRIWHWTTHCWTICRTFSHIFPSSNEFWGCLLQCGNVECGSSAALREHGVALPVPLATRPREEAFMPVGCSLRCFACFDWTPQMKTCINKNSNKEHFTETGRKLVFERRDIWLSFWWVGSLSQGFQAKNMEFDRMVLSPPSSPSIGVGIARSWAELKRGKKKQQQFWLHSDHGIPSFKWFEVQTGSRRNWERQSRSCLACGIPDRVFGHSDLIEGYDIWYGVVDLEGNCDFDYDFWEWWRQATPIIYRALN